jgi:hypothetical protein
MEIIGCEIHAGAEAVVAKGFVKRAGNFEAVNMLAEEFAGEPGYASIKAFALVGMAFSLLEPDLPGKAKEVLIVLIQHTQRDTWKTGNVKTTISNARLAGLCGLTERSARRLLGQLEEHGWLVRRYTNANQRYGAGGIDLRPLARRLPELENALVEFDDKKRKERERLNEERIDLPAPAESPDDPDPEKSFRARRVDTDVHLNLYNKTSGLTDLVQGQAEGGRTSPPPVQFHSSRADSDMDLVCLMTEASPTLQRQLSRDHLEELLCGDPSPSAIQEVSRSIVWLLRQYVRIRPEVWQKAVAKHGWAALAAVLVAVDKRGIKNPAAYLYSMLQSSILRETIHHNLRALSQQDGGHA